MPAPKSCLDCKWNKPMLVWNECTHPTSQYRTQGKLTNETAQHTTVHMRKSGPCGEAAVHFERRP